MVRTGVSRLLRSSIVKTTSFIYMIIVTSYIKKRIKMQCGSYDKVKFWGKEVDTWIKTYIDIRSKLENNSFSLNFLSSQKKKIVIGKNFQKIRVTKEGRKPIGWSGRIGEGFYDQAERRTVYSPPCPRSCKPWGSAHPGGGRSNKAPSTPRPLPRRRSTRPLERKKIENKKKGE